MLKVDLNAQLLNLNGEPMIGKNDSIARFLGVILGMHNPPGIDVGRATEWARSLYKTGCLTLLKTDRNELVEAIKNPNALREIPNTFKYQVIEALEAAKESDECGSDAHTD